MQQIYTPDGQILDYPHLLRTLYNVNDLLKRDGIMAPSDDSVHNTEKIYNSIGRPLDKIATVHIGGTNGKGTTSFKLAESLRAAGLRTGLFVSPHLASFRERVQVNGELISEEDFVRYLPTVMKCCVDQQVPLTLFELTFILASLYFEGAGCEAVVLEVGLGGQLDATNVVRTSFSIVCSVSLDHTRVLGPTVEEIGRKKAGIFKKDIHALIGPGCPLEVMQEVAVANGAILHKLRDTLDYYVTAGVLTDFDWDALWEQTSNDTNATTVIGTTAGATTIIDTDRLNTMLSLAALCLLKDKLTGGTTTSTGGGGGGSVFDRIDVRSEAVQRALHARPPCRWEVHHTDRAVAVSTTTTTSSLSPPPSSLAAEGVVVVASATTSVVPVPVLDEGQRGGEEEGGGGRSDADSSNSIVVRTSVSRSVEVVLDVGHNPAAMGALTRRIVAEYRGRPVRVLYAMSRDKDVRTCLRFVLKAVPHDRIHFAQSKNFRAVSRQELSKIFFEETNGETFVHIDATNVREAVSKVIALAAEDGPNSVVVICGTGYIMPDARAELGLVEPRDDIDLQRAI